MNHHTAAIIALAVFIILFIVLALISKEDRCPECRGTLFDWSYDKMKCRRDGRQDVEHKIY